MTFIGLVIPMLDIAQPIVRRLTEPEEIRAAQHPLEGPAGVHDLQAGPHGTRGNLTWDPVKQIIDALDEAFYLPFAEVQPTGLRHLAALSTISRMPSLPAQARDGESRISTPPPTPSPSDAL